MNWIKRFYEERFNQMLQKGKVLVLHGSRQVGKTSLVNRMIKDQPKVFKGDGNDLTVNELSN